MANFIIGQHPEKDIPIAIPGNSPSNDTAQYQSRDISKPSLTTSRSVVTGNSQASTGSSIIDVVGNYDWASSPKNNIIEQPYIILHEYRVSESPMVAELRYLITAGIENVGAQLTGLASLNSVLSKLDIGDDIIEKTSDLLISQNEAVDHIKPFLGLYSLESTGFIYKFPYFTNKMVSKDAEWSREYPGDSSNFTSFIQTGMNFVAEKGSGVPFLGPLGEAGIYIERSKYFAPRPGIDPIQFSFPLLNTLSTESIQKNFNLIWLLCFQTSSIRKNKTSVFPPCIYKVLVPGVRFMLYASIDNISIDHLGTRRRISITHPANGRPVETIIPEAYNIKISINSLTTDNGNFMLESLRSNL